MFGFLTWRSISYLSIFAAFFRGICKFSGNQSELVTDMVVTNSTGPVRFSLLVDKLSLADVTIDV